MFNFYDFCWQYPAPRALTANQLRVKHIKAKIRANKMLKTKKGKR